MIEKEDKEIAKGLDFNKLKAIGVELNKAIDEYNAGAEEEDQVSKVKVIGKKVEVFQQWRDAVEALAGHNFSGLPASSVDFYNEIYPEEEDGEVEGGAEEEATEETYEEAVEKEKPKSKPKASGKKSGPKKAPINPGIKSFDDLKKVLSHPSTPTAMFDSLTLKGGKLDTIVADFKQYLADNSIDFKSLTTVHSAKRHIEYRQSKGWVYEEEKEKIKLVGFEKPTKEKE